jgi:hypothetical protein
MNAYKIVFLLAFCKYGNVSISHIAREQFNKLHDTYANKENAVSRLN